MLHRFKLLMRQYPMKITGLLVQTPFVRPTMLLSLLKPHKKIGIDIAVITGVQEAILVYAGVVSALPA